MPKPGVFLICESVAWGSTDLQRPAESERTEAEDVCKYATGKMSTCQQIPEPPVYLVLPFSQIQNAQLNCTDGGIQTTWPAELCIPGVLGECALESSESPSHPDKGIRWNSFVSG